MIRWLDERKGYRRPPLLLALEKAEELNLSNATESKSPEQALFDDMVDQLRAVGGR